MIIPFSLEEMRGDTIRLRIPVERDGSAVDITGATFRFTARKWLTDVDTLIEKDNSAFVSSSPGTGVTILTIDPEDTAQFTDTVTLNCDVEMTESDGLVTTVARGKLKILLDTSR